MAKQSKHRNSDNFALEAKDVENVSSFSETVPDQTPDLVTLLGKRSNGHIIPMLDGKYTDEEIPDLELMDTVELLIYREELAEAMEQKRQELHEASKEAEKRKFDHEVDLRFKQALAEREQQHQKNTDPAQTPGTP